MTPPNPMPWFQVRRNILYDVRFNRMPADIQMTLIRLTSLADDLDAGGIFTSDNSQLDDGDIAWQIHLSMDAWEKHKAILQEHGYLVRNGHGYQLKTFEGQPGKNFLSREKTKEKVSKHRAGNVTGYKPVSNPPRVKSQSQSQESESESIELTSQSVSRELLNISGVPSKYWDGLTDIDLTVDDYLAELARNYARRGGGKGEVKNPPHITAMNLLESERAAAEWYNRERWTTYIPRAVLQFAHPELVTQGDIETGNDVCNSGYTNFWVQENPTVTDAAVAGWRSVLETLEQRANATATTNQDGSKIGADIADYQVIQNSSPYHVNGDKWQILVNTSFVVQWLNEHNFVAITQDLLLELTGQRIAIEFVWIPQTEVA